ncbi:unnamed protein product [Heterobilharzia americana]|nr:unnamed protein product [Heterobilharzia americana]
MPPKRNKTKNTERKLEKIEKLTPKEAVLDYQIGNLRVSISRLKFKRETLRNALIEKLQILSTLKMEGENLIKETSSKILNSSAAQESSVSSDVTKTYLLETWKIRDEKEKEVKEVEEEIRLTQSLTKDVILELRQWQTYADNTKRLNDTRIQMLEKEYNNMKKRFQSMIEHLTDMRNRSDQDLHTKIENASESIRNSAVENMVNTINKTFSHQMLQNKFLKIENKSLADRIEQISSEVSELQEDNLLAVREIFETKLPHVLLPLSFSDNQVTEADDLHTSKILDLGMSQKLFDFKGQHGKLINFKMVSFCQSLPVKMMHMDF